MEGIDVDKNVNVIMEGEVAYVFYRYRVKNQLLLKTIVLNMLNMDQSF